MNKTLVLEGVIRLFEQKLIQLEQEIAYSWKEAREAPSAVESFSDGSRREAQEKGIVLEKEKKELQATLNILRALPSGKVLSAVGPGALVQAVSGEQEIFYFLVPSFGGDSLKVQNKTVLTLSPESPLGKMLMNKQAGEEIVFNGRKLQVVAVT